MRTYQISEQNTDLPKVIIDASSRLPTNKPSGTYELYDSGTLADTIKQEEAREEFAAWIRSVKIA